MFNVDLERREGLFGLARKRESLGQIYPFQFLNYHFIRSLVTLSLGLSETSLLLRASGQPVSVEFPAGPRKLKPTITVTLDKGNPEIILSCGKIIICPKIDHSQRLVVTAPGFQLGFIPLQEAGIRTRLFSAA